MKRKLLFALCTITFSTVCFATDNEALTKTSQKAIKTLGKQLKTELISAMKSGGPINALAVCNTKASPITKNVAMQQGLLIGRTSLKLRNPKNQPDKWELDVLKSFEQRHLKGEKAKGMAFSEVVDTPKGKVFRYMQAIPTGKACLACHGAKLAPAVSQKLHQLYPQDQAIGFTPGDIRGAFSVQKELN